jgi:hypothetical protein
MSNGNFIIRDSRNGTFLRKPSPSHHGVWVFDREHATGFPTQDAVVRFLKGNGFAVRFFQAIAFNG